MSRNLLIVVPKGKWPSIGQLNAAFRQQSFPLSVPSLNGGSDDKSWILSDDTLGIRLVSNGTEHELEAEIRYLTNADGASGFESYFLDNEYLAELGAKDVSLCVGDVLLEISFPLDEKFDVPADEWTAGAQIGATLIRHFGGFGFIDETEDCGTIEFADRLLAGTTGTKRGGVISSIKGLFER